MATFFAFRHSYGARMVNPDGRAVGELVAFSSRVDRDRFVVNAAARVPYVSQSGYTEAWTARQARRYLLRTGRVHPLRHALCRDCGQANALIHADRDGLDKAVCQVCLDALEVVWRRRCEEQGSA